MKAMILAAGRGARLRPLTDKLPKALVEVAGEPLLAIVMRRLAAAGVREVVINLHHLGGMVEAWIARHGTMGMNVLFSHEPELLDTGGALKHAAWFFDDERPFLVHNVDVLSDIDLGAMVREHERLRSLATLACMERETARPLLFDTQGALCGRRTGSGDAVVRPPSGELVPLGFCGIHVIEPALVRTLSGKGAFSIIETYLEIAAGRQDGPAGIRAFRADGCRWRDAGRLEDLRPLGA